MKKSTIQSIQAVGILAGAVLAWIFIPEDILVPLAWGTLVVCVGFVWAIKAYMNKLNRESRLAGPDQFFYTEIAMAFALVALVAFITLAGLYA